jgi:hypothetical protein
MAVALAAITTPKYLTCLSGLVPVANMALWQLS